MDTFHPGKLLVCLGILALSHGARMPASIFNKDPSKNWAVLVAGSNGWWNYRHQADVCHAYQILRQRGVPEANIITMMYDDIANNPENPFRGKIFNDYEQKDVYKGVVVDYKKNEVNSEMFVRMMKADPKLIANGKKVLRSGPEDHVFVFFSDHGADGLICFPEDDLYASKLNETLTEMFTKKRFGQLVLYIEACFAGSMFHNILSDQINVYATTAANHEESSYAAFCDGHVVDTCMSDEYSYNWMIDSESHDLHKWTLDNQFQAVKSKTKNSHVMKYGNLSMGRLATADFETHGASDAAIDPRKVNNKAIDRNPSHKAHLLGLTRRMLAAKTDKQHEIAQKRLHRAIELGHIVEQTVQEIVNGVESSYQPSKRSVSKHEQMNCFESVFSVFKTNCFSVQQVPEVAQHTPRFQELCRQGYSTDAVKSAILAACT